MCLRILILLSVSCIGQSYQGQNALENSPVRENKNNSPNTTILPVLVLRSDSTFNEELIYITQKLLTSVAFGKIPALTSDLKTVSGKKDVAKFAVPGIEGDTVYFITLFQTNIRHLQVRKSDNDYYISPEDENGKTSIWINITDKKSGLKEREYSYLIDYIENQKTRVLYRVVRDISANEKFSFSFNNPQDGISKIIKDAVEGMKITPYEFYFDSSQVRISIYPDKEAEFYMRSPIFSMIDYIEVAKAYYTDGISRVGQYLFKPADKWQHYFSFIRRATMQKGKITSIEHNLMAFGPCKEVADKNGKKTFVEYFIVRMEEAKNSFTRKELDVIYEYLDGNFNHSVEYRWSSSVYALDSKKDTAIIRILRKVCLGVKRKKLSGYKEENCLTIMGSEEVAKLTETGSPENTHLVDSICAVSLGKGWYRTDPDNYENDFQFVSLGPAYFDTKRGKYKSLYSVFIPELNNTWLGTTDAKILIDYVKGIKSEFNATLHVNPDRTLSDGSETYSPLNLFDSYKAGDEVKGVFERLYGGELKGLQTASIYIKCIQKAGGIQEAIGTDRIPFYVHLSTGNWGLSCYAYSDLRKRIVIPPQFVYVSLFHEDRAWVGKDRNDSAGWHMACSFIDPSGKELCPYIYYKTSVFKGGRCAVKKNKKWGFVDRSCKEVISLMYDTVRDFSEGLAAVRTGHKWHFIDSAGNAKGRFDYDWVSDFSNGASRVVNDGKWELLDLNGKKKGRNSYDTIGVFNEGLALIKQKGRYGFVSTKNELIIRPELEGAGEFHEGLCPFRKENYWGFIDKNGNVVIPPSYEGVKRFSEGLAVVKTGGKWGVLTKGNQMKLEPRYQFGEPSYFSEGIAGFYDSSSRLWGLMDSTGKIILKPSYVKIEPFQMGAAIAMNGTSWDLLGKDGERKNHSHLVYFSMSFPDMDAYYLRDEVDGYVSRDGTEYNNR
jgi:hypothetical protein